MPYKIQGKVIGTDGYPIDSNSIIVKEIPIPGVPWSFSGGSTVVDQGTGFFTLYANNSNSLIEIDGGEFIIKKTFVAKDFTGIIEVEENVLVIEGKVTPKKKDNSTAALVALGILATVAAIAYASNKKSTTKANPASPAKRKPKVVTV